jgi:hypothetical protein
MKNEGAQLVQAPRIPPAGMPKLFFFEYDYFKKIFQAVMCPELAQQYEKIRIGGDDADLKLPWALEISSKISTPSLDCLINKMGGIRLMLTDEQCENDFGEAMAPDTKSELIGVMIQCCQVVQALQESIKPLVLDVIGKFNESANLKLQKEASKILQNKVASALRVLTKKKVHGRTKRVTVSYANGTSAYLPLAARIIEMTLEEATKRSCIPCKAEIEDAMKAAHPHLGKCSINWSAEFKKAGLSSLPQFKPWERDEEDKKIFPQEKNKNTNRNAARAKRN